MKKISNLFFSMTTMGILLLVFAASIGTATFIENDFGTLAAKAVVYNAVWFEVLLGLLAINLIANIFRYRMFRKEKFTIFLFHFAFLIILLGAAITRFISYEGILHLREGKTSNEMFSDRTYVISSFKEDGKDIVKDKHVLLSVLTPHEFHEVIKVNDKKVELKSERFIAHAREVVRQSQNGEPIVLLVASSGQGRKNLYLKAGQTEQISNYKVHFGDSPIPGAINILINGSSLNIIAPDSIKTMPMGAGKSDIYAPNTVQSFAQRYLYTIGKLNLVQTGYYQKGKVDFMPGGKKNSGLMDVVWIKAKSGSETKEIALQGGKGFRGIPAKLSINGVTINLRYGAKDIKLPFSIKLRDFQLERYPGSRSPSSYASQITVIDTKDHKTFPYHIYMNHVLNYKGYRFFQSSYDQDEKGSILSVNHDYWGTFFTYAGYILLTLGMFLSLLNKNSYFAFLGRYLKKINSGSKKVKTLLILLSFTTFTGVTVNAQNPHSHFSQETPVAINKEQAKKFGELLVQTTGGRVEPVNTLASEILRKITRKSSFKGMNPDQVLLGMLSQPMTWQTVPMIKVSDKKLAKLIGIKGKYASYLNFINMKSGTYKLQKYVEQAYERQPAHRDMFDKEVMKVDERMNIAYMIYTGKLLKMIPDPKNAEHPWYSPASKVTGLTGRDSLMVVSVIPEYLKALTQGKYGLANELLTAFSQYQRKFGASIIPSESKIKAELLYNRLLIFFRLAMFYGLIGFALLILVFADILKPSKVLRFIMRIFFWVIVVSFLYQTFGLALRWYISGHAPWSNGYESMIYIGWVTMLAGILFSRKSMMTVAATTLLVSIILFVAHLSWMDPEITNLVPVLKSYWLTIHVSVITASYGFLALGALLGFFNMVLMILKTPKNYSRIEEKIGHLTAISERTIIVGLYMLTIGTFLGGVWANESWGRYWGWDPKETWALVSVLVYSFIVHMRFIPGLKSRYTFNLASVIGYFSILMTYFGVNYYLSGMHSYAKGDPVPIPDFVYYTIGIIILIAIAAYNKEEKVKRWKEKEV